MVFLLEGRSSMKEFRIYRIVYVMIGFVLMALAVIAERII